jgi:tetratricopeptide (TPR) repeat protein
MDIWRWVYDLQRELNESGRPRLAELTRRIPGHVVNHEHAQLDAIVPEALALAREAKSPWLELFIRHWNLQSRILHRHEATAYLPEAVRLLELASRDEARDCPQSVCVIQDLAGCYAELDGPGYAPDRLAVARETLARIDAKWPCFTCISSEYAYGLIDDGSAAGALAFLDAQAEALVDAGRGAAARHLATARTEALLRLDRLDEALGVALRARETETDVNDQLTHALDAARILAKLGRCEEALLALPPFDRILPTPSLYERWTQAMHALALALAVPGDWKLEARFFELETKLAENGVVRVAIGIAHRRAELAIARDRLGTAEHAAASIRALIPRLRRPLGADDDLARLDATIAAAHEAVKDVRHPPGSAELVLAQLTSDPETDLEILAAGRARFPDEERLAIIQASARRALSRSAEAEAGLRAHLAAFPGAHGVLMTLGQSLLDQKRSPEARALAEASLAAEPKGEVAVGAHFLLATAYQQEDEREKARPHLEAMLALEPGNLRIELLLASLDREAGRLEESLARLDRLVEREPRAGNHDWDRMVTATLLGRWDAVRASAIRIGMNVQGEGPIEEAWGLCRIELREADGEVGVHHALRTGPVTARILDVARPRAPQHYGDEIVFEAAPRNPAPKAGEENHTYLYPAITTRKPGEYEAFLLDGVHPGAERLEALRADLKALGCVLAVQSDATYLVTEAATDEARPGLLAYLAAPAGCSRRELHDLLTRHGGTEDAPLVWPGLAQALELTDELERQAEIIEHFSL